jgi:hypothetical protein
VGTPPHSCVIAFSRACASTLSTPSAAGSSDPQSSCPQLASGTAQQSSVR